MPVITNLEAAQNAEMSMEPGQVDSPAEAYRIADDRIEVMPADGVALADGRELGLTKLRLGILTNLASRADSVVSLSDIWIDAWGEDMRVSSNAAHMQISLLRKSLGEELGDPREGAIRTRHGFGYSAVSSLSDRAPEDLGLETAYLIADGRLVVCPEDVAVVADGRFLDDVRPLEFRILSELARRPNRVMGMERLGLEIWGYADRHILDSTRTHISNLRKRLGPELGNSREGALRTRHGIGYYAVSSLDS